MSYASASVRLSVIIPTKDRSTTLIRVLRALEHQYCDKKLFEVIVIDDKSSDDTFSVLKGFAGKTHLNFRFLTGGGTTPGAARNIGLHHARGDWVLFLDADTIPDSYVIRQHLHYHQKMDESVCVIGYVHMDSQLEQVEQARRNETMLTFSPHTWLSWPEYRTANSSMSRQRCLGVGGFDETLVAAEDTELSSRLARRGMCFYYIDSIRVCHSHPMDVNGYFKKGQLYGQAAAFWYKKSPDLRPLLVQRYGVFARETHFYKKIKYIARSIIVNRLTVPAIAFWGHRIRSTWTESSDRLYQCVYRYRTRRAFRQYMTRNANG